MEMSDRIKLIIKSHNLTASSFAEQLGVQRSSVSHLLSGRNKPSLDVLQKILTHFPRVDAAWLITGKQGEVQNIREEETAPSKGESDKSPKDQLADHQDVDGTENRRQIESIVTFYKDGSFEIHHPVKKM